MDNVKKAAGGGGNHKNNNNNNNSNEVLKLSGDDSPFRNDQRSQQKRPFLLSSSKIHNEMNGSELVFIRCASYLCSFHSSEASTEFSTSQLVHQSSSLLTNRNKQQPNVLNEEKIISNHLLALENSLTYTGDLTIKMLCQWHGILCGNGLSSPPTELRTKRVRCGPMTNFCDAKDVSDMMKDYVVQVNMIMTREDLEPTVKAAAISLGLVGIHPFIDGNGRLGRILVNWVLHQCGVPFTLSLCATPQHRASYIASVRKADRTQEVSAFAKYISVVLLSAWEELDRLIQSKQAHKKYVESQVEDGIVKQRENRRLLPCLICLGDQPNIAMMCCNGPVHIQCMTDWLTKAPNPVCMQCREPLPRIVPTFVSPPSHDVPSSSPPLPLPTLSTSSPLLFRDIVAHSHSLFDLHPNMLSSSTSFRDMLGLEMNEYQLLMSEGSRMIIGRSNVAVHLNAYDYPGSPSYDEQLGLTRWHDSRQQCSHCHQHVSVYCSNELCGTCCRIYGTRICEMHGRDGNISLTSSSSNHNNNHHDNNHSVHTTSPSCCVMCEIYAAASDCAWACCGRCCVATYGYGCPRHAPPEDTEEILMIVSEENDETETEEEEEEDVRPTPLLSKCDDCGINIAARYCDYGCCGRCCRSPMNGDRNRICFRHNPEPLVVIPAGMNDDGSCRHCPNAAARNCENFCCGKCCISTYRGQGMHCSRHHYPSF